MTNKKNLCSLPGDITQKGYEKKKQRLLAPYMASSDAQSRKSGEDSADEFMLIEWKFFPPKK